MVLTGSNESSTTTGCQCQHSVNLSVGTAATFIIVCSPAGTERSCVTSELHSVQRHCWTTDHAKVCIPDFACRSVYSASSKLLRFLFYILFVDSEYSVLCIIFRRKVRTFICHRINFKLATLTHNTLNSSQPAYLRSLLSYHTPARYALPIPICCPFLVSTLHSLPVVSALLRPQFGTHSPLTFVLVLHHILSVVFLKPTFSSRPTVPPSRSHKCLRFGLWSILRTINILFTYLLTYRKREMRTWWTK